MLKRTMLIIIVVLAICSVALAGGDIASASEPTAFDQFVSGTLQPLFKSTLDYLLPIAIGYALLLFKRKTGIDIANSTQQKLNELAADAVHLAEERGAVYLKESGNKMLSEAKYKTAIDYVLTKAPTLTPDEADDKVHAALAKFKGLGASREVGLS